MLMWWFAVVQLLRGQNWYTFYSRQLRGVNIQDFVIVKQDTLIRILWNLNFVNTGNKTNSYLNKSSFPQQLLE